MFKSTASAWLSESANILLGPVKADRLACMRTKETALLPIDADTMPAAYG